MAKCARLNVKYNRTLTTKSHVTLVTIPSKSIGPHICNTKKEVNSQGVDTDSDFVIWKADAIAEYEDNSDSFVSGSNFPVAVDIDNTGLQRLDLHIDIAEEQLLGIPLEIYGDSDVEKEVIKLFGSERGPGRMCFARTGVYTVPLMVAPSWARRDVPWGVVGNIVWRFRLAGTGRPLGLNSSRLEFYALNPNLLPFFSGSLPVTLARRFVLPLKKEPADLSWERYYCSAAFYDFSFQYDATHGRPSYLEKNGNGDVTFRLHTYLSDIGKGGKPVNCYDQACIMQVCLALLPAVSSVEWMYMDPFGFIKTTVVVGRGACNNPFYNSDMYDNEKVCDNSSQVQSGFGNHAFVRFVKAGDTDGKIVDACTGPHLGDETLEQFINSSIDRRRAGFGTQANARAMGRFSLKLETANAFRK